MDEPTDYYTKLSKSHEERQILQDITYMWNLKNNTNELIYETKTDSQTLEKKLMVIKGEVVGSLTGYMGLTDAHHHI